MEASEPNLPKEVLKVLREIGVGLTNHSNWLKVLHRTLICDGRPNADDLTENAHQKCKFGAWYYGGCDDYLIELPQYKEVGELHEQVHDKARQLLQLKLAGNEIVIEDYDEFIDVAHEFRVAVQGLQFTMVSQVCAVDHLTGVWNRYALSYKLSQELERVRRTGSPGSVALMDFDKFKRINDKFGHVVGDQVLKSAMEFFSSKMRKYDAIFRYGGEEFLFLFPDTPLEQAKQIVDRLREDVKNVLIETKDNVAVKFSVSVGVAQLDGDSDEQEIIGRADRALLNAKTEGRDCVRVWG